MKIEIRISIKYQSLIERKSRIGVEKPASRCLVVLKSKDAGRISG